MSSNLLFDFVFGNRTYLCRFQSFQYATSCDVGIVRSAHDDFQRTNAVGAFDAADVMTLTMQLGVVNLTRIFFSLVTYSLCLYFQTISRSLERGHATHNNMDHLFSIKNRKTPLISEKFNLTFSIMSDICNFLLLVFLVLCVAICKRKVKVRKCNKYIIFW